MKIYYFSIYDFLRARTNQIADMRLCEGFSQAGCDVELIAPYVYRRDNMRLDQVFSYFGVETPFRLKLLKTPFVESMGPLIVLPLMLVYVLFSCLRIWLVNFGRLSEVVIISQTTDLLIPALLLKKATLRRRGPLIVSWAHDITFRGRNNWVYRRADAIVATNSAITADLSRELGIPPSRMAISLNPISESQLRDAPTREAARARLGVDGTAPLVVYTGKVFVGQKEIEYLLEAARRLPGYRFLLTGGKENVVRHFRDFCAQEGIGNTTFVGFLHDASQVRYYQAAADVLVSYYTSAEHLTRYQLPNKTCEYMLAGSPIVTCDFPATRDVLNGENAIFVEPENADALASGIRRAIEDRDLAGRVAGRALRDVRDMTFRKRAGQLAGFFGGLLGRTTTA
jgi:glycosyltransferase involved in cell wall biosynthesis